MDWSAFSLGAVACLILSLIVDLVHKCPECVRRAEQQNDPWDWINAGQFRSMVDAADARFLNLHRRYTRLKSAAQKFRDVDPKDTAAAGPAAIELDAALIEQEPEPQEPTNG